MSQRDFDRFAPVIGTALRQFPTPICVNANLSLMQPLRYAIKAKRLFGYRHSLVDEALFATHGGKLKVFEREGLAWIGVPVRNKTPIQASDGATVFLLTNNIYIEELCAVVGALQPCPRFAVASITQQQIDSLSRVYGVSFVPAGEGRWEIV